MPIPAGTEAALVRGRADIVLTGIEQAGPSFELRVFVNNLRADAETPTDLDQGYAGSVYVYGYGTPPAGREHIFMTRYVVATDALRAAAGTGSSASVTLVPIAFADGALEVDLSTVEVSLHIQD